MVIGHLPETGIGAVSFVNQQPDGLTLSTDPTEDSADTNLIDDIIDTYDVDFHTLYNNVVECKKPDIRVAGKHPHHQPSTRADNPVLPPPGNVCCLLANKNTLLMVFHMRSRRLAPLHYLQISPLMHYIFGEDG
jgi:hypothetical protein